MLHTCQWKKGKAFTKDLTRAQMLSALAEKDSLVWVDLQAPTEFESDCLVEIFNFHPLAVEDCLTDHSQPKVDDYEEYLFLVTHALMTQPNDEGEEELRTIELDIFFGRNYVVTFHKTPVGTVEQVRNTVERKPEILMAHGSDVLVHAILDRLVDNFQPILDRYDDRIDKIEEAIFHNPPADYLETVIMMKRDVFNLRKIVSPQRDLINYLTRTPTPFITAKHRIYFRDIYDHLLRIYSIAEGFHESLSSVLQAYFSYSSHKLNEIIKHMTVLATLTMPAVIVASIYGMNFRHMPELTWKFGYGFSFLVMAAISGVMLIWMKWKKWI
ncbi:MAG: magnesium/cobalt transporter CorA [Candidatus Omnitrophota bacterium]|nr:magnesium/cobalt transporter CorA [Candidatus Omnitrophota bacterium]